jgi:hypothetical protein
VKCKTTTYHTVERGQLDTSTAQVHIMSKHVWKYKKKNLFDIEIYILIIWHTCIFDVTFISKYVHFEPLSTVWYVVVLHFTISRRWKYTLFFDIWNTNPHFIGISIELTYSQCSFEEMFMNIYFNYLTHMHIWCNFYFKVCAFWNQSKRCTIRALEIIF